MAHGVEPTGHREDPNPWRFYRHRGEKAMPTVPTNTQMVITCNRLFYLEITNQKRAGLSFPYK